MGSLFESKPAGPDLSYEPEDMYLAGGSTGTSFSDWVKRNLKEYGPAIGEAAVKGMGGKEGKAPDNVQSTQQARARAASYMGPGRVSAGPFAAVGTRPDYETMAQNAFRDALVRYILENPKANIKGML